ncbi:ATP-binding protein [Sphingorhabdus sp. Alg239-R122]|uniref:sensor histidine kinase n=1 Tax=Sphingorhabdus sp. Alg239-R122 TaxID=2305989 RepID=UPI0023DDAC49|nr:ATP-binding protein [Sphingorhabdus sp. Alg239-R122]
MVSSPTASLNERPVWRRKLALLARNDRFFSLLEISAAAILIIIMAISYSIISDYQEKDKLLPAVMAATLLVANLVPAMALLVLFGRRIARGRARKSESGSDGQLHIRLVGLFSLLAAIPTLLVVVFASLLFQYGVEFWFSDRSRNILENANELAKGYYAQSTTDVGNQTEALAKDLREYLSQARIDSPEFSEAYSYQVLVRSLSQSAILQIGQDGQPRVAVIVGPDEVSTERINKELITKLKNGEEMLVSVSANRVEAVAPLDRQAEIYLYTARRSDLLAFSQGERAQEVLNDYDQFSAQTSNLQLRFNLALFFVSLLIVGIALWAALRLADRMVRPLDDLAVAAREISMGNFTPRVTSVVRRDEVGMLGRAFNRMAQRLEQQTQALMSANEQLDNRRAFIEAIVESATAGIISVDTDGHIRLMNNSAQQILRKEGNEQLLGEKLTDIAPQFAKLIEAEITENVIQFASSSSLLTLAVKIVREPIGHVITFEDITQQLLDQRQAAWSDVAQRIAHEIKNPLTPIQLATERLKRRYTKEIVSDPEIFANLTETIIRQVGDLRNMVDEFSSFAKMPKPVFREENYFDLVKQAVFMHDVAHGGVEFELLSDSNEIMLYCDRRQIGQAITNIIKNAVESIESKKKSADNDYRGKVSVQFMQTGDDITLSITDNGVGLPDDSDRLIEPYVTTREKGTGLGLAIVKKIVEEHFGEIAFDNADTGGAEVVLTLDATMLKSVADGIAAQPEVKVNA